MTTSRTHRPAFPMDSLQIVGEVDADTVPQGTHAIPGVKRRWQDIGERIRALAPGKFLLIKVAAGADSETVRQGISSELVRFELRARIRSVAEADGSSSLYIIGVPRGT